MPTATQNETHKHQGLNEIELKLSISQRDAKALFKHPIIQSSLVGPAKTRRLISTYYDTPSLQLLDTGISLRTRNMSGAWFQAVKSTGSSLAGLHQRMEWEDIITGPEPDFSKITEPSLAAIFADIELRQALRPIFTTDVRRTECDLDYESSKIEIAYDFGKLIIHSQAHGLARAESAISEIELELKKGKPIDVFALAIALQNDIALKIENTSKAEYGYGYFRTAPFKSSLSGDDSLENPWECLQVLEDALKTSNHVAPILIESAINRLTDLIISNAESEHKLLLSEFKWVDDLCKKSSDHKQLLVAISSQRYQSLLLKLAALLLKK